MSLIIITIVTIQPQPITRKQNLVKLPPELIGIRCALILRSQLSAVIDNASALSPDVLGLLSVIPRM